MAIQSQFIGSLSLEINEVGTCTFLNVVPVVLIQSTDSPCVAVFTADTGVSRERLVTITSR